MIIAVLCAFDKLEILGWTRGLEPPTTGSTIQCSNQLSYAHHTTKLRKPSPQVAPLTGLEPVTYCLEGSCSIH